MTAPIFLREIEQNEAGFKKTDRYGLFLCKCGKEFATSVYRAKKGLVKSCGCLKVEVARKNGAITKTHGMSKSPEYYAWRSMFKRCYKSKAAGYARYGRRGITVCSEWKYFDNFLKDMGRKPSKHYSIDRIDNNGNYEPSNCRWANSKQQGRNRSTNVCFSAYGVTATIAEWAEILEIPSMRIYGRILSGWDCVSALFSPKFAKLERR